jgi:hypothetical protein
MDRVRSHQCMAGHDFRQEWKPQRNHSGPLTLVTSSSRDCKSLRCYGLTPSFEVAETLLAEVMDAAAQSGPPRPESRKEGRLHDKYLYLSRA